MAVLHRNPAFSNGPASTLEKLRGASGHLEDQVLACAGAMLHESEERYRLLLEHTFDFVVEIDAEGRFLHVSPGYETALGYAPDELIGQDVFAPMHPDDIQTAREAFSRGMQNRSDDAAVFRYRHKNGEWRWFESSGRPFLTSEGELRVIVCSRDITERRRADEELREELRVSTGVERVARAMISMLHTPQLLRRLCELAAEELGCDTSITMLRDREGDRLIPVASFATAGRESTRGARAVAPPAASALLEILEHDELFENGQMPDDVLGRVLAERLGLASGLHVALRVDDRIAGVQSIGYRDRAVAFTSRQKRLATGIAHVACLAMENARLFETAEQANRLKSEFLATVSHELRTPLHIIIGYNDLLLAGEFGALEAEQSDILGRVAQNSRELSTLIDATLDVGRLEAGRAPLSLGIVHVAKLIGELRSETDELRRRSRVPFGWHVAADVPPVVSDSAKLKLVVKNLIANAVKFTERGTIGVGVHPRQGGVSIAVADTGIGIPSAELPYIFESFRQVAGARARGGVGLGLYIVRRTVDLLGGSVTVKSVVGRGSTFRVWIPATPPDPSAHDAAGR